MSSKSLVIVESPSKGKTIGKFLGSKYKVIASVGHVRDLPKSKLGIDIENNYEPNYISIRGKGDIIKSLKKEAKNASRVYLATDPDREGEAISWHIAHLLGMDIKEPCRIVFNEITKTSIRNAVKNPRPIDEKLVDAQQARRILDRLVGYQISPLLWRKIRKGLSAGRVQSAALKMICDREKSILAFVPEEYWVINALLEKVEEGKKKSKQFSAKLTDYKGKKVKVENQEEADGLLAGIDPSSFIVKSLEEREKTRRPYPPFTTSSMQQEASTRLGFQTRKTMLVAQQLYEGIDVKGHGTVGLVTYIRTDSVRISDEARGSLAQYIETNFTKAYLGNHVYANKKKATQDAHEAIRPSDVSLHPDEIKDSLTKEQYGLYKLIWARFVASGMAPAVYDNTAAEIENGDYLFRATGSRVKFDGFLKVYRDSKESDNGEGQKMLPKLSIGEKLNLIDIMGEQNFTQPPSRFTEASLVKELEERGIGRPSTYAPIMGTLIERKYVTRSKRVLTPTELGFLVTDLMEKYFKEIVDADFTANLEDRLDDIEVNNEDWKGIVDEFYKILKQELEVADREIEKIKIEDELTDEVCELCGKPMVIKQGRYGEFLACSGYPDCRNTKTMLKKIGVECPKCGKDIVARKSKTGRLFYGCSGYPECDQAFWNRPVNKSCPKCGALLTIKGAKNKSLICSNSECGHTEEE
ncbi:MAG: type I DNA topoisomerase [Anaerovoracaceae bacterium]|jgi:DNA topoisomerase-1